MSSFQKATRKTSKLRLGLTGPAGSGKTYGALTIARELGTKIACIDTEHGSASLYSDMADFDVLELSPPYSPERYIAAIKEAEKAGYEVLIIDSGTHEWNGAGGVLELVDEVARAKFKGNSWSAWNEMTPRHRKFIDTILQSTMHVITTLRSKTETAQVEENGRKKVVKLGMKAEQRDGIEFELTVVLDLTHDGHYATASKDRTRLFAGDPKPITAETGRRLLEWLNSGAKVEVDPSEVARYVDGIDSAEDMVQLKAAFGAAYRYAQQCHSLDTEKIFEKAKDERKLALTAPTSELGEQA
jgi:hypothetical protein